jgi:phosphoribosylformylglycinamidine synthase PurS subunit
MSKFRIGVKVMPLEVILDTQGRAIEQSLRLNNMAVETARVGRFVELEIQANTEQEAMSKAHEISKKLLCNSLIENFEMIKL